MNKIEIIQQLCDLRHALADLQRSGMIDKRPPKFYPLQGTSQEAMEEQMRDRVKSAYGCSRARVDALLRRIATSEDAEK